MSGKINHYSIIIPFKTGKQYLIDCLQSVLAQDYPHFEIIVLADITSNTDDALHAIKDLNNPKISVQLSEKIWIFCKIGDASKTLIKKST